MTSLRKYFVAGLLVWLPLVATFVVLSFAINLIDRSLLLLPVAYRPETLIGFKVPGLGVILTVILIMLTGLIAANFFGRKLVAAWEAILSRIPLVRTVYGAVKQITQSLFADASQSFVRWCWSSIRAVVCGCSPLSQAIRRKNLKPW